MKTNIEIQETTRTKLVRLKYNLGCKTYDEVIQALIKLTTKFKLGTELEEITKKK